MRFLVFILLFVGLCGYSNSFTQKDGNEEIYTVVDEMPEYPGGIKEMVTYLQKNILYPVKLKEEGKTGKVYVKFVVDSTGKIGRTEVIKSSGYKEFDEEGLRVVKSMPRWNPGRQAGRKVSVWFNLPVSFNIYNPKQQNEYYNAGVNWFKAGNYKLAIENFDKAINMRGTDIDALYNASAAALKLNDTTLACEYWKKINDQNIHNADKFLNQYCGMDIKSDSAEIFTVVEKMPGFPGGNGELMKYVQKTIIYPQKPKEESISGISHVKFVVEKDGSIANPEIGKTSGNKELDKEALRVVSNMPKWNPGIQNGKPVRVLIIFPVRFQVR